MNYTQSVGNVVELQCIAKFMELGYEVSIPYGNGAKYDFIADVNGEMLRIQCKSCSNPRSKVDGILYDTNAIQISTVTTTTNTQKTTRHLYTSDQIDYFATAYNGKIYLIPVDECSTSKTLRFTPPQNNNQSYNKAEDYEIEKFISISEEMLQSKEDFINRTKKVSETTDQNKPELFCSMCGNPITSYSKTGLCQDCWKIKQRKQERPSREELKAMIRTMPFTTISKKYNVTDNAIRKWCDMEKLPRKKKDIEMYSDEEWSKV